MGHTGVTRMLEGLGGYYNNFAEWFQGSCANNIKNIQKSLLKTYLEKKGRVVIVVILRLSVLPKKREDERVSGEVMR
jgi:hypothetical protein